MESASSSGLRRRFAILMMLRHFPACRSIPSCGWRMLGCPCPVALSNYLRSARVPANASSSLVWRRRSSRTSSPCGCWDPSRLSLLPPRFDSSWRILGGYLKSLYSKPASLRGPERRWFLHPSVSHRENILNVASEHVMLTGGVCLACVAPLPNNSPDRAWLDSAPPLGMPSTLVEWGVMRLLRSSFVEMLPESTSSSPIFGNGDTWYLGLCWW